MSKLSRRTLVSGIGTFISDDEPWFLIDNVKLVFSPSFPIRSKLRHARPLVDFRALVATDELGLKDSFPVTFGSGPRGPAFTWKSASAKYRQEIGWGMCPCPTLVADSNAIRVVRSDLSPGDEYRHQKFPDNYIDPRVMSRRDAHERCLRFLNEWVTECCKNYCATVKALWNVTLEVSEVLVSVNVIELAWDARTRAGLASLACKFFRDVWKRSLANAVEAFEIDRLEFQADGVLKARGRTGEILKLYAKTNDLVRFEAQLTKHNGKKIAGERLDPTDAAAFSRALRAIAKEVYSPFLQMQLRALSPPVPALSDLFDGAPSTEPFRYVQNALLLLGVVKTRGQADYKVLTRLRERGLVRIGPGKGYWSATDAVAETLGVLRRLFESEARWRA
jgi:hypothetical protein